MANPNETPWWKSPWTCGIGGCCLGCVAIPVFIVAVLGAGALGLLFNTDVYREALVLVREDPRAVELLGEPIETGWQFNGRIDTSGGKGIASFSVPISGPSASGVLEVEAEKQEGEWVFRRIRILPDDGSLPLDLVGGPQILEEGDEGWQDPDPEHLEEVP